MNIIIRGGNHSDIPAIAQLSVQLGYSVSVSDTQHYLQLITGSANNIVYVAVENEHIVGWMQVSYFIRLESGAFCEIVGLVIDERYRGKGIGKLLIGKAAEWCRHKDCNKLKVRTNVTRKDTHRFYAAAGFTEVKEQKIYEMNV